MGLGSSPSKAGFIAVSRYALNTLPLWPGASAHPSTPVSVRIRNKPLPVIKGVLVMSVIFIRTSLVEESGWFNPAIIGVPAIEKFRIGLIV